MLRTLRRLAAYGGDTHAGQASQSWHAISNQVWLWNMAITLAIIPLIAILFLIFADLLGEMRWRYLLSYLAVPVCIATVQTVLFWWGNRLATDKDSPSVNSLRSSARRSKCLHLLLISDCLMVALFSLLIGASGGVHFLFLAFIPLPFYFFRRGVQPRAWLTKGLWVFLILALLLGSILILNFPAAIGWQGAGATIAMQPLPAEIIHVAHVVIGVLAVLITTIVAIYFWWQLDLAKKMLVSWDKISTGGVHDGLSSAEQEWLILANRMIYFIISYLAMIYPVAILFAIGQLFYCGESREYIAGFLTFFLPTLFGGVLLAGIILIAWLKFRQVASQRNKHRVMDTILILLAGYSYWNTYLYPISTPFGLMCFPIFVALLMLRSAHKVYIDQVIAMLALAILCLASVYQEFYGTPFVMLPPYILVWASPTVFFLFFATLAFIVFYLRHESDISKSALSVAHAESEKLLLNILPAEISLELKLHGKTSPREFSSTTVLFTDFVGFTRIAENLTAVDLVSELDKCFSYFDSVVEKYGLEKLKTIGPAPSHPWRAGLSAPRVP